MQVAASFFDCGFEPSFSIQSRRTCSPGKLANLHRSRSCLKCFWDDRVEHRKPDSMPIGVQDSGGRLNSQARDWFRCRVKKIEVLIWCVEIGSLQLRCADPAARERLAHP